LSKFTDNYLENSQVGFRTNQQIQQNVLIIDSIVRDCRLKKTAGTLIFLDQNKAFDRVSHKFLFDLLDYIGLDGYLKTWLKLCYIKANANIIVNNNLTEPVPLCSGVRQGDPLSPLLYNLVYDVFLTRINQKLAGYQFNSGLIFKSLSYADDSVIFISNELDMKILNEEIDIYKKSSGAQINFKKSVSMKIFGTDINTGCKILNTNENIMYLGFCFNNMGLNIEKSIEKVISSIKIISNRIKSDNTTIMGRIMIANTLLISKAKYIMSIIFFQKKHILIINNIIRQFLWRNLKPKVRFDFLKGYVDLGSLGLTDISISNLTLKIRFCPDFAKYTNINNKWKAICDKHNGSSEKNSFVNSETWTNLVVIQKKLLRIVENNKNEFLCLKNKNLFQ
jgi:hypothetical protein